MKKTFDNRYYVYVKVWGKDVWTKAIEGNNKKEIVKKANEQYNQFFWTAVDRQTCSAFREHKGTK